MSALLGKKVVVIGGTSGIGRRVAELSLHEGATVVVGGRNVERLNEARRAFSGISSGVDAHVVHATDIESLQSFFKRIGTFDHLVSMVGGAMGGGFASSNLLDIEEAVQHKVFDNLRVAQLAVPFLSGESSLTFTGGTGGKPHTASGAFLGNAGLLTMTQGLAVELAPRTRVNLVAPTWMETPFWRDVPGEQRESIKAHFSQLIPLQRTATIDEVADAYLFLLRNTFITGQQIAVDGGVTLAG